MSTFRRCLLTFNNSKDFVSDIILKLNTSDNIKYACSSDEIGLESQLYHTHVFIIFNSPTNFDVVKNMFPQNPHIDICKGSSKDNRDYVFKEGKHIGTDKEETNLKETHFEIGIMRNTASNDFELAINMIDDGLSNLEIVSKNNHLLRYVKQFDLYRDMLAYNKFNNCIRHLEVYYLFGAPATGKSSYVFENNSNIYVTSLGSYMFDEYARQDVVLFDDFRDSMLPIQNLLRLLDIYPLTLPARYNNKIACYTKVFITSNITLTDLYCNVDKYTKQALLRRIHHYYIFTDDDIILKDNNGTSFVNVGTIKNIYSKKGRL